MKRWFCVLLLPLLLLSGCGAQEASDTAQPSTWELQSRVGDYFDTAITITVYWPDEAVLQEAMTLCAEYEQLLSKTQPGSDVWRINQAGGERVAVSEHTRLLLEKALYYSEQSAGAFDVTVAPVVALWGFGDDAPAVPQEEALAAALTLVDYRQIDLDADGVRLPAGMSLDLGAIAKGYICDRVAEFLLAQGVDHAILNFGGDLRTIGTRPDGSDWLIGIQNPQEPRGASLVAVAASGLSVVTSGVYERGFTQDGVWYHHILEPASGYPVQSGLASVSILGAESVDGDALATACLVLGIEQSLAWLEDLTEVEAIFILEDNQVITTPGLAESLIYLSE